MTRYQAEFETRRKRRTEGWADLADRAFPDLQADVRECLALQTYLQQLDQPQVAFGVKQTRPKTLYDAVAATLEMESYAVSHGSTVASVQEESPVSEENLTAATVGKTDVDPTMELTTMMGKLMKRMETLERQQTRSSAAMTQGVMPERNATNRFTARRRRVYSLSAAWPHSTLLPTRSSATGKLEPSGAKSQSSEGSSKARNVTSISPLSPTDSYRLQVVLGGIKISLLLDTGAAVTLIRKDTWDQITSRSHSPPLLMPCPALDGSPLETHGKASLLLELEGNSLPIDVIVVNSLTSEGILGLDFLKKQRASINFDTEVLHLPNHYWGQQQLRIQPMSKLEQ